MVGRAKLKTYRSKRDFAKTREPSGDVEVAASQKLRFVIQKHDATRLHYDLRLELDGTFKSWAVTKGPSLDPADKRLAVEVEDHPLAYGDFEGTIAKGQYGGGTVQLWDRGYWAPEPGFDPQKALAKGELKFELEGERLHGGWVLVRMKRDRTGGKRQNWLLIKHRDAASRDGEGDAALKTDASIASGRDMATIAAGAGAGAKPFMLATSQSTDPNAMWDSNAGAAHQARVRRAADPRTSGKRPAAKPVSLPAFILPQLCQTAERPPNGGGWAHEIKFDGYRVQMRVVDRAVTLKTRKGLDWTERFGAIARAASRLPNGIIDGEIVALNADGAPDFAALQAALSENKTDNLIFFAFDVLFDGEGDQRQRSLAERKERLRATLGALKSGSVIRYVEHFETGGDAVLRSACRLSLEGIVSKRLDAPYQSGRTKSWTKAKCRAGHEVVIGGWSTTAGKFRSLLVGVHRGEHFVYVGRVGTGYGAEKVKTLLPRLKGVGAKESPFTGIGSPRRESGVTWTRPELVAEIEFAGWTGDGMVRQAAFKALREDKPADEVEVEIPAAPSQTETPKPNVSAKGRKTPSTPSPIASLNSVMGVIVSHPDKALWPNAEDATPVTKLDLARYLEAASQWIMEHIQGRPCSLIRAPDGVGKEQFFQRHAMQGSSSLFDLVKVSGDHKPYLVINRREALASVAQIAGVELHPWNCQRDDPAVPGRLVFDLDPGPDVAFAAVVRAAIELRDRLSALGLISFCKSTGGKGLHVVTPFAKGAKGNGTWPTAKDFARAVCAAMANDDPTKYVINMAKNKREGRIFLDYLRNDRMATAVAPLSPRARPGAHVSMPLNWAQVKPDLDPARFTMRTAIALLRKSKAWADYGAADQTLERAIERMRKPIRAA